MVEQGTHKPLVGGSNPSLATIDTVRAILLAEGLADFSVSQAFFRFDGGGVRWTALLLPRQVEIDGVGLRRHL